MKRKQQLILAVGTLVAMAGVLGEPLAAEVRFDSFLGDLGNLGYEVEVKHDPMGFATLHLTRVAPSEERHGLFRLQWKNRETWELRYKRDGGSLSLVDFDGALEQKAPLFGRWEEVERNGGLPDGLLQMELSDVN